MNPTPCIEIFLGNADFGEMLTWWSLYFAALPALWTTTPPAMIPFAPLIALVSPAFITFLLMKVSGIPLLEKKYAQQYAGSEEFQQYVRNTPLLLPNPLLALRSGKKTE
jgi:steroid 5-alpha reductase family enzyme